jgi:hypothetical protein
VAHLDGLHRNLLKRSEYTIEFLRSVLLLIDTLLERQ